MPTLYTDQVQDVLNACHSYRKNMIDLEELKSALWRGVETILAVEEADYRRYLQSVEGRLDMIQFTSEDERSSAMKIVWEIEKRTQEHIS